MELARDIETDPLHIERIKNTEIKLLQQKGWNWPLLTNLTSSKSFVPDVFFPFDYFLAYKSMNRNETVLLILSPD